VPTILLVEDDRTLAEGLAYNLDRAGYRVVRAGDGPGGLALAESDPPDLVVLDVMLPGLDGFAFLERLRARGSRVPVIVLSALDAETDKVRGLDLGADDYLAKPFGVGELLARIRARLGDRGSGPASFRLGDAAVHLDRLEFERDGKRLPLTPKEASLLRELHRFAGAPVAREVLLRALWGVGPGATRTLDTHVARLRRKIERDPAEPRHLLTVHGVGYRLDA
jgi:DNA-binding response OmpR family regulator